MSFGPPETLQLQAQEPLSDIPRPHKKHKHKKHKKDKKDKKDKDKKPKFDPQQQCFFCHKSHKECHCKRGSKTKEMFAMWGLPMFGGSSKNKKSKKRKHRSRHPSAEYQVGDQVQTASTQAAGFPSTAI